MRFYRPFVQSLSMLLCLFLSGCTNITASVYPEDTSVAEAKIGRDCATVFLGFGFGRADIEVARRNTAMVGSGSAIPLSDAPITKVRRVELVDHFMLAYFGERCVYVTGE